MNAGFKKKRAVRAGFPDGRGGACPMCGVDREPWRTRIGDCRPATALLVAAPCDMDRRDVELYESCEESDREIGLTKSRTVLDNHQLQSMLRWYGE
jgi:hypothetical protein